MRSLLSTYGWVIVTIIVLSCLIVLATPYGQNFMSNMYFFTNVLTAEKNHYIDYDDCKISINNPTSNVVYLTDNIDKAKPGSVVTLNFENTNELACNSVKLEYNGQEEVVNSTEFLMPNYDVVVTPLWTPATYSKIYFNDLNTARLVAQIVDDSEFSNSNRTIEFDGETCYIVHDDSVELGYNNQCHIKLYNDKSVVKVVTGKNCKSISAFAFKDAVNLKYLFLSDSVETINNSAFRNCTSLSKIVSSNKLERIDTGAFYNCKSLTGIFDFDSSITYIGDYAFSQTGYEAVIFPQGLETLGSYAFYNCKNLTGPIITDECFFIYGEHVSQLDNEEVESIEINDTETA